MKRYYTKRINHWRKILKSGDTEVYHGIEDEIFELFIRDISRGKWSDIETIQHIATQLKTEILDTDRQLWYS